MKSISLLLKGRLQTGQRFSVQLLVLEISLATRIQQHIVDISGKVRTFLKDLNLSKIWLKSRRKSLKAK